MIFAEHMSRMWWSYVVIFVMLCLSAYFSASEIALQKCYKFPPKSYYNCFSR